MFYARHYKRSGKEIILVSERDQKPRGFVVRRLALKRWLTKLQEHKVSLRVVAFIRDFCDIGSSDFHCSIGGSNFRIEIEIKVNDWNAKLKQINNKPSKNKQTNKESVSRRDGRSVSQSVSQSAFLAVSRRVSLPLDGVVFEGVGSNSSKLRKYPISHLLKIFKHIFFIFTKHSNAKYLTPSLVKT